MRRASRHPPPALASSLGLVVAAVSLLAMPVTYRGGAEQAHGRRTSARARSAGDQTDIAPMGTTLGLSRTARRSASNAVF